MKKFLICVLALLAVTALFLPERAYADELGDSIDEQLGELDLSELEEYLERLKEESGNFFQYGFLEEVKDILNGKFNVDYGNLLSWVLGALLSGVYDLMPTFLSVVAIAVFCGIFNASKGDFLSDEIRNLIFFVCFSCVVLLLINVVFILIENTRNTINNIANFNEIMSPVIFTLMAASGGTVSVSVYQPAVAFLTNGIVRIILDAVLPLSTLMMVFSVVSNLSVSTKLTRFVEFFGSLNKWLIGISFTVFTFFLSVQGITAGGIDGISLRATKYAISNSIPIVGGYLKDGVDLVIASSVLIKNAVGVVGIIAVFFVILSPLLCIMSFQLLLKLTSAVIEPLGDGRLSGFCASLSKNVNYLTASILSVGLMLFLTITLIICSANAFI